MNIIFVLIPLSLVLVALAGWAFFWSVNHSSSTISTRRP